VFGHKEQPLVPLNVKISKDVTITSITHVNDTENNILSKLKKLPGITINLVKSEPVFKVPEPPKLKTNSKEYITPPKIVKGFFEQKGLAVRIDDSIEVIDKCLSRNIKNITNMSLNPSITLKQKPKQIFNTIPLITKSSDRRILKNPEATLKKYSVSEKENIQRTSSPKKLSKKILSSSSIKS